MFITIMAKQENFNSLNAKFVLAHILLAKVDELIFNNCSYQKLFCAKFCPNSANNHDSLMSQILP